MSWQKERRFGKSIGAVLTLIGVYLMWRGRFARGEILAGVGVALIMLGLFRPALLKWPSAAWWRLSHALGYVQTRLLLTLIFILLFVPLGALWRALGRDPLGLRRSSSGWQPYPARYGNRKHYDRMY